MKEWFKENIMSSLTLAAIVTVAVWYGGVKDLMFTTVAKKVQTEKMVEDVDPIKLYGEYIVDSIEQVETEQWRAEQMIKDSVFEKRLIKMDSLLRLNVRISNEAKKATQEINEGH